LFNFKLIFFSFNLNLFLLSFQLLLKFSHLFFILNMDDLFNDIAHYTFLLIQFRDVTAFVKEQKLFLQFCNLVLIFSKQSILWILVNLWLVLDVLSTICISKGVNGFIVIVVGGTNV